MMINNPGLKGQLAAPKKLFGKNSRYAVAPVHSSESIGSVGWFVWDAETPDASSEYDPVMGFTPGIIRIASTYEEAVRGLE